MASRGFTLKQFHVNHDRCAMKVGTDGILLGAWAPLGQCRRILDVGTGSGLVALMLAQRGGDRVHITGLELDSPAAAQATENVAASPWPERLCIEQGALQQFEAAPFELIVSNPPYFAPGQAFDCAARASARHGGSLSLAALFSHCERLLSETGQLCLVLPWQAREEALLQADSNGLFLLEQQQVMTREGKSPGRFLLRFGRIKNYVIEGEIVINTREGGYGDIYKGLVSPFYLKM
ncbi:SmtA protein [Oceanimonas sp. GK1]|uniref:tRNA1(Val) (adenine(37)-N6)-methyltransferase n=1 Tax=Oceanimonas sp. (strain GK1 / IBRC-M 10197) TaxID=511062 RepID=UPI00024953E2|nr:methyltransferase [Oceanimonas sp. GK1]AEY02844.1 SmtA protein [Oceanimonas sp. GK1]